LPHRDAVPGVGLRRCRSVDHGHRLHLDNPPRSDLMTRLVIDISHYQQNPDFAKVKAAGIVGVIMKVSEGVSGIDDKFAANRRAARAAGLLIGGYHFVRPGAIAEQAQRFLLLAAPDAQFLMVLDNETAG